MSAAGHSFLRHRQRTLRRIRAQLGALELLLAGGTTGAVALESPAYAGGGGKARWLVDSSLAMMKDVTTTVGAATTF